MKLPNSYGSVTKLSGKRRNPYIVRITTTCVLDEDTHEYIQKRQVLGYYRTKSEALKALADYNKHPYSLDDANMTFKEVFDYIKTHTSLPEKRIPIYESAIKNYLQPIADMKIKDIKTKHLQSIIDNCEYGSSVKKNIKTVMKRVFKYALENDLVDKDYSSFVTFEETPNKLVRKVYTTEEILPLWDMHSIEADFTLVLLHQGCRIKELMELKKENTDFEANTITFVEAKNKRSIRTIPINHAVLELVKKYHSESDTDRVFNVTKWQYEKWIYRNTTHLPYDARHTFATRANELELKTLEIQRIMGHTPETILEQVYTHLSMQTLQEAIDKVVYK